MNLYTHMLMDHYKNPQHRGKLAQSTFMTEEYNPSCGDAVQFWVELEKNTIKAVSFMGNGCVISQATASMLADYLHGKDISVLTSMNAQDLLALLGIELGPTRLRCALLSLEALKKGVEAYAQSIKAS